MVNPLSPLHRFGIVNPLTGRNGPPIHPAAKWVPAYEQCWHRGCLTSAYTGSGVR